MIQELIGEKVVVDLRSAFVCLGTLQRVDENFLELRNADLHDLSDTETSRETYVAHSIETGIKRNRRRVFLVRTEVIAVARMDDVVDSDAPQESGKARYQALLRAPLPSDDSSSIGSPGGKKPASPS